MINLCVRTEFSFRFAYGKVDEILEQNQTEYSTMTDRFNTFGHIPFWKKSRKANKKVILGVELAFVSDATMKTRQNPSFVNLIAKNQDGLSKIYDLVSKSTTQKYYFNRLSAEELLTINDDKPHVALLSTSNYELRSSTP